MTKITSIIMGAVVLMLVLKTNPAEAGNPDRQGEAGAYELLLNPWARSAGLNGLVVSNAVGIEAMRFNPAGVVRANGKTQVGLAHTQYLLGTGVSFNAGALAQQVGKNGAFGVSLMALDFGDIPLTTTSQPEGFATFRPAFFNIGLSYGHVFRDKDGNEKISVGLTVRMVSESIANATATGVGFDAGVQYVTGADRQIKFGLAIRNIGTKMRYRGDGLSFLGVAPNGSTSLTVDQRPAAFELPSLLHIGASYDFLFPSETEDRRGKIHRLTTSFQFTANSFSRDQFGLGVEYSFRELFMVRAAFKYESNMFAPELNGTIRTGFAAGVSGLIPLKKESSKRLAIDYGFELTRVFGGIHTVGLTLTI